MNEQAWQRLAYLERENAELRQRLAKYEDRKRMDVVDASCMARMIRVKVGWLKEEAAAGRIPCLDAGGRILFHPETVEAALVAAIKQTQEGTDASTDT